MRRNKKKPYFKIIVKKLHSTTFTEENGSGIKQRMTTFQYINNSLSSNETALQRSISFGGFHRKRRIMHQNAINVNVNVLTFITAH